MTNGKFHADAIRGIVAETERNTLDRVLDIIDDVYHEWSNNNIDTAGEALSMVRDKVMELGGCAEGGD